MGSWLIGGAGVDGVATRGLRGAIHYDASALPVSVHGCVVRVTDEANATHPR